MKKIAECSAMPQENTVSAIPFLNADNTLESMYDGLSMGAAALQHLADRQQGYGDKDVLRGAINHLLGLRDEVLMIACEYLSDAAKEAGVKGFTTFMNPEVTI